MAAGGIGQSSLLCSPLNHLKDIEPTHCIGGQIVALVHAPNAIGSLDVSAPPASRTSISALVREHSAGESSSKPEAEKNPDLARAFDLMELHKSVKLRHSLGEDLGLVRARRDVEEVMKLLDGSR